MATHWRLDDVRGNSAVSRGPKHCSLNDGDLGGFPTQADAVDAYRYPRRRPHPYRPRSRPASPAVPAASVPASAPSRVPSPLPSTAAQPSPCRDRRPYRRPSRAGTTATVFAASLCDSADPLRRQPRSTPLAVSTRRRRLPFHAIDAPSPRLDVPTNAGNISGEIDRSTLYRYDASVAGVAYTVQEAVVSGVSYARGEVIYTRTTADGGLSEKGHFCLEDGCFYLDLSGETVVRLRSATDDGPKFSGLVPTSSASRTASTTATRQLRRRYRPCRPLLNRSQVPIPAPTSNRLMCQFPHPRRSTRRRSRRPRQIWLS